MIAVEIQPLGESRRVIADRALPVKEFRILAASGKVDIKVFYHSVDGRWVGLESVLENGRTLRYTLAARDLLASAAGVSSNPPTGR